jgi:hypothetical protein
MSVDIEKCKIVWIQFKYLLGSGTAVYSEYCDIVTIISDGSVVGRRAAILASRGTYEAEEKRNMEEQHCWSNKE